VNGDRVIVGAGETRTIIHVAQDPRLTALRDRPSDDGGVQPFDVAILQLNAPITTIAPIRLAQPADGALYAGGAPLTTIGFGSVDADGNGSGVLRFAHVQARSDAECSALLAPLDAADSFVGAAMTCTTDPDKVAPFSSGCYGDSGGPLVAQATDGTLVQVGVDDWGVACGFKNGDPENYVEVPVIAAFALAAAPSWRPEPTRRPKFTGTVKVGRKVRCSLPRFSPAAPPDKVSRGFFRLVRTADGNEFRLVGRGASLRIKRKLRGKRLTCAAVGHSPGGTVVTYALRTKKVAR
jgi:hypothetical protein